MNITAYVAGLLMGGLLMCPPTATASIEKLQATRVPLLALLIEAFEVEGEAYNLFNESGAAPYFHSARWNPASRTLEWRFWVSGDGSLQETLRNLPRPRAVALLKGEMSNLAVFVGLEPMSGFEQSVGSLQTANVPGRTLISETDWDTARQQLAKASIIHLAAPHPEGPILLMRTPQGRIVEETVPSLNPPPPQQRKVP